MAAMSAIQRTCGWRSVKGSGAVGRGVNSGLGNCGPEDSSRGFSAAVKSRS